MKTDKYANAGVFPRN